MTTVSGELDGVIHEIACVELGDDQPVFQSDPTWLNSKKLEQNFGLILVI